VGAPGHDRYCSELYSGILVLRYCIVTPLHVGSGVFESATECGLSGKDEPVRGIVRRQGQPVLPGSSWKGAVRARFEAVTRSRLALAKDSHSLRAAKVPRALQSQPPKRDYAVKFRDSRLSVLKAVTVKHQADPEENERQLEELSPAESLFGTMGYRGRVHPADGFITSLTGGKALQVAPMESPAPHRLAKPGQSENVRDVIVVREVEGRKFYYDGDIVSGRNTRQGGALTYELVDSVPVESDIELQVHLETVTLAELGALLICSGYGGEAGVLRFGGFKPAGLGKVKLTGADARLHSGMNTHSWKQPAPASLDLAKALLAARSLIDAGALAELETVTTLKRA
jgi:hypothetical protein